METNEGSNGSPEPEPKIIGITGGIGSGKSTVAEFIKEKGFPVYNSDYWAKELVNHDEILKENIINLLGRESYDASGRYHRKWVSEQIFENNELLEKLNSIIHPAVKMHFETWIKQQHSRYIFKETALLFELRLNESCHHSILVTADDNLRMKRVMDRDAKTYREVEKIMEKQMPEKDKMRKADFIIYNNGSLEELKEGTEKILDKLIHI